MLGGGSRFRTTPPAKAVAMMGNPAVASPAHSAETRHCEQRPERPQPPHGPKQASPRVNPSHHPAIRQLQSHLLAQRGFAQPESGSRFGRLQRRPHEAPRFKHPAHALAAAHTQRTGGIEEDPALSSRIICIFSMHRNTRTKIWFLLIPPQGPATCGLCRRPLQTW